LIDRFALSRATKNRSPEHDTMAETDRRESVAGALRDVLEEGEAFNVYCHEGEVYVDNAETSVCAGRYPRLYGRLLSLSTQLEEAGSGVRRIPILLALIFCIGVHLHWWDEWFGAQLVNHLDSIWFFVLIFYVLYQSVGLVNTLFQRGIYQRAREDLFTLMAQEDIDRDLLLAMIEGDYAVARAGYFLKLDRDVPDKQSSQAPPR
jgi:hypothetical protein